MKRKSQCSPEYSPENPPSSWGAVQAVLVLVAAFGLKLTAEQMASLVTASAAFLALVVRRKVSPVSS